MRLLLINFEMNPNSGVLAWQQRLAVELAKTCERVVVMTGHLAGFSPPANMEVHVVPKLLVRLPLRLFGAKRLMNLPAARWCREMKFDACFIHMAHEWAIWLGPTLRRFGIPTLLWYAHGATAPTLYAALDRVDRVVTSTPEGFRIPSPKVHIIGQGIDADLFCVPPAAREPLRDILYVGRISARKRVDFLLEVAKAIRQLAPSFDFRLRLVGPTLTTADQAYLETLLESISRDGLGSLVEFCGKRSQAEIAQYYRTAFLHLNLSQTGSMDKTVMEALACGCPVLTSNEAIVGELQRFPEMIVQPEDTAVAIARKALHISKNFSGYDRAELRGIVLGRHDLNHYVASIRQHLSQLADCTRDSAALRPIGSRLADLRPS